MANQNKASAKKGGWGSMLSSAVAGLESRLDTILADDPDASAKQRAADVVKDANGRPVGESLNTIPTPANAKTAPASEGGSSAAASRDASRSRGNQKLAERLARITAQKNRLEGEAARSRTSSPARVPSSRTSMEVKREIEADTVESESDVKQEGEADVRGETGVEAPVEIVEDKIPDVKIENGDIEDAGPGSSTPSTLLSSNLPINPARHSVEVESSRPSMEVPGSDGVSSSRPSFELSNGNGRSVAELEAEMERMRSDHEEAERLRQEEMHANLERIDALQAKLQYLAKETVAAAKEANASTASAGIEKKIVEKDEQIALLMEEGAQLSKTELRHLQTIKKLRAKGTEDEKAMLDFRKKLDKAERSEMEHKHRVRRAEVSERQAVERSKQIGVLEKQADALRAERDKATDQILALTSQLRESEKRAERAALEAQNKEADKSKIADLENELEDAQIEKKLAVDRAQAEIKKVREDSDRQRERWTVTELELVNEIKSVEARLEAMRARAEEASSEAEGSEGSTKLLRQIELLQHQYNLAKSNWETIEGSLNTRLVAMEKDRDEASRREAEVRKKARETGIKARKAEEDVENGSQRIKALTAQTKKHEERLETVQRDAQDAATALADAKADFDRQRRIWDSELSARLEEEKNRWQRSIYPPKLRRNESNPLIRNPSVVDIIPKRGPVKLGSPEPFHGFDRNLTRRSSAIPTPPIRTAVATPDREYPSPSYSQQDTVLGLGDINGMPPTPSADIEADDQFDGASSPQATINDIVSTTVTGAGPSVQLVERMSAAVRRLEGEKAAHKDELARLGAQRDEARDQIVALMREVEGVRAGKKRIAELDGEMAEVQQRYEACLEIIGEREEEVDDLRADVAELKKMYRELVEQKVGK